MLVELTQYIKDNYKTEGFREEAVAKIMEMLPEDERTPEYAGKILDLLMNEVIPLRGGYSLNLLLHAVYKNGDIVELTPYEMKIVEELAKSPCGLKFDELSQRVWHYRVNNMNIRVYINRIRQKMGPEIIDSLKGEGYRLNGD